MKTLSNGMQCEILKVFRGQSNNYKANYKTAQINGIEIFLN